MIVLLSRNRVRDFKAWKALFDEQTAAAEKAGLSLLNMWTDSNDANNVFFTFAVQDVARARAFLDDPQSAEVGMRAGVLDGEYHFLNTVV